MGKVCAMLSSKMTDLMIQPAARPLTAGTVSRRTIVAVALTWLGSVTGPSLAAQPAAPGPGTAAGPVFRLKGSEFSVNGRVTAFDGKTYFVETQNFGAVEINAQKFDCIGQLCPSAPFAAKPAEPVRPVAVVAPQTAAPLPAPASAPAPAAVAQPRRITISGSSLIGKRLMPELIEAFAASTGAQVARTSAAANAKFTLTPAGATAPVEFELKAEGNEQAFRDLETGSAKFAMTTRPIEAEEAARLATLGLGNFRLPSHEHVVALDGLMVAVAQRNPAVALSIEALAKILAGEITDWSQLKLPPGKITTYAVQDALDGPDTLTAQLLQPRGLRIAAATQRATSAIDLAERLARDPNGLGIGPFIQRPSTKALTIETSCGLIVKPSAFSVKSEEYPLSRPLYLYTAGDPADPTARAFLAFATSPAAHAAVRRADFVDQEPQSLTFSDQTDRLAYALNAAPEDFDLKLARTMISDLRTGQRMSLTFRFQGNSDQLSARSLTDMNLLVASLTAPANLNKRAMLIGFSDSSGTFPTNLRLAERRTASLYRTFLSLAQGKIDPVRIQARSYGKLAPVACNDSITHRALNRRVEVWLQN